MRALAPEVHLIRPTLKVGQGFNPDIKLKVGQGFNPDIKQSYDEGFSPWGTLF